MPRIGFGFDTHRLEPGRPLRLGGVNIPHTQGCAGHSDADVLVHAIIDAMLGAAGLRDIGSQFPDSDPALKGIDSMLLLSRTMELVVEKGFRIGNLDCTVVLESPKLAAFIPAMIASLTPALCTEAGFISIKAKTSEKMGFIGREEGVSAYAVVLLETA